MVVFGRHKNIMLISYQKAALKLLCGDNYFMKFLNRSRYVVFDEAHYLIDDSDFNKGVNVIADYLVMANVLNGQVVPNQFIPNATRIFMSGSMEEMFVVFQQWGYDFNDNYVFLNISDGSNKVKEDKALYQLKYMQTFNHITSLPTDYSYISPYI